MYRTVTLLALALVAGCVAGGGPTDASGPPDAAWATDGGIEVDVLARHHWETIRDAGTFTHNQSSTHEIDGDASPDGPRPDWYSTPRYTTERVNLDSDRITRRSVAVEHTRSEIFISPDEDASRRKSCTSDACSWEYSYLARSDLDSTAGEIDRYRRDRVVEMTAAIMDDWNYTFSGMERRDGRILYRYTADWMTDKPVHPFTEPPAGEGTLVVNGDGVIRSWSYRFTGPGEVTVDGESRSVTVTQRYRIGYFAVGDTTVDRPAWVGDARAADSPPKTSTGES